MAASCPSAARGAGVRQAGLLWPLAECWQLRAGVCCGGEGDRCAALGFGAVVRKEDCTTRMPKGRGVFSATNALLGKIGPRPLS